MAEQVPKIEKMVHIVKKTPPLHCPWWDPFRVHTFFLKQVVSPVLQEHFLTKRELEFGHKKRVTWSHEGNISFSVLRLSTRRLLLASI